jgi:hypothetical protein
MRLARVPVGAADRSDVACLGQQQPGALEIACSGEEGAIGGERAGAHQRHGQALQVGQDLLEAGLDDAGVSGVGGVAGGGDDLGPSDAERACAVLQPDDDAAGIVVVPAGQISADRISSPRDVP